MHIFDGKFLSDPSVRPPSAQTHTRTHTLQHSIVLLCVGCCFLCCLFWIECGSELWKSFGENRDDQERRRRRGRRRRIRRTPWQWVCVCAEQKSRRYIYIFELIFHLSSVNRPPSPHRQISNLCFRNKPPVTQLRPLTYLVRKRASNSHTKGATVRMEVKQQINDDRVCCVDWIRYLLPARPESTVFVWEGIRHIPKDRVVAGGSSFA